MSVGYLTSDLLSPVRHGFFTRRGGASSGVFAGLNCALSSSDQGDAVRINRARVAAAMGVAPEGLATVPQVHSADVIVVERGGAAAGSADAMVSSVPGVALGILTADCMPILLADDEAGVVGAAHAGWKGALGGVIENTVEAMVGRGAERLRIRAAIGPAISQAAYEVGPEMLEDFMVEDPEAVRYFAQGKGDRLMFDLVGFGLDRLRAAGVEAEWIGRCTYREPDTFFSYRRATHRLEADYGRLISVVRLN
ncbi:peptidoglycan editing factor PgeF [Palleronia sp.]|uniref:peptidoglycan editing factor PgeF n=1 Tax=Palleronia sp. TaxID=1940284 RepID=UPI0035C828A5